MMRGISIILAGLSLTVASPAMSCETSSGEATVLYFFRSECNACEKQLPEISKLHQMSGGEFKVFGISLDDAKTYERFVNSKQVSFPTIRYEEWECRGKFPPPENVPMIYYIDTDGKLRGRGIGWFSVDYMRDQVLPLAKKE